MQVKIKILENFDKELPLPSYESPGAAGADIRASLPESRAITIEAGQRLLVPTGLSFEIPINFEIQVRPRSGLSLKTDLLVVNSPGTVDSDYRGELKVIMGNFGKKPIMVEHGDRVAQLIVAPIIQADFLVANELSASDRGSGGFGSTGVN